MLLLSCYCFLSTLYLVVISDCWNGQNKKNGVSGGSNNHQHQQHQNQHAVHGERFGSYRCDSTWQLVVSAVQAMKAITGEDIEFLLWTGYYINLLSYISIPQDYE